MADGEKVIDQALMLEAQMGELISSKMTRGNKVELHYTDDRVTVYHGDCIEVMRQLPDNSVDAVVTDPPYGLEFMGKDWDAPWKANGDVIADPASVGGFQDGAGGNPFSRSRIRYGREGAASVGFQLWFTEVATEALRVLKPGGHLLAFGGTRTWHRLAVAIEDAGFEVRDSIAWMYGSGFPKSLDVSKAIDKKRDDRADIHAVVRWLESKRQAAGVTRAQVEQHFGTQNIGQALFTITEGSTSRVATWDQWQELKALLKFDDSMDGEVWRLNGRKGKPGEAWAEREVVGSKTVNGVEGTAAGYANGIASVRGLNTTQQRQVDITAPATPAAEQWQGWGTALKPAHEPIVVARKPLMGTVAENVLTHGTGALNIDGCRIGTDGGTTPSAQTDYNESGWRSGHDIVALHTGRWPANVILDESQAAELDKQSGVLTSGKVKPGTLRGVRSEASVAYADMAAGSELTGYGDSGGASRFFYVAKANKKERPNVNGVAHPTVKPMALMQYLVRLVTPPGGTVLEPFAGSGTTIEAALNEGFNVIGIEMTDEYLPLIMSRIERYGDKLL